MPTAECPENFLSVTRSYWEDDLAAREAEVTGDDLPAVLRRGERDGLWRCLNTTGAVTEPRRRKPWAALTFIRAARHAPFQQRDGIAFTVAMILIGIALGAHLTGAW